MVVGARLAAAAMLTGVGSGCTALTIATAIKEPVQATDIDARVSSRAADVDGVECYLEKRTRSLSVVHVSPTYKLGSLVYALAGTIGFVAATSASKQPSGCGPTQCPDLWALGLVAGDGLIAVGYAVIRDRSSTNSESWQLSNETAPCRR